MNTPSNPLRRNIHALREHLVPPVFLFQMGKVGSSSLRSTLQAHYPGLVVQAHHKQMLNQREQRILHWRMRLRLPVLVICPVRDPLSRNISAFFQNFKRDTGFDISSKAWTQEELTRLFLRCYPHQVCLEWFDQHLRTLFGLDVLSQPFPIERKWRTYRHRSIRALIYRADLEKEKQLAIISSFIGQSIPAWIYENVSENKDYGKIYKDFVQRVRLPEIYVSLMCQSRFCRTFWSETEIERMRNAFSDKQTKSE